MKLHDLLTQHAALMPPLSQTGGTEHLGHRTAPPRYVRPLLGALVCLLLVVGTSQATWVNVPNYSFPYLCPDHLQGDREYGGNGPDVHASTWIYLGANSTSLYIWLHLSQLETRPDRSAASKTWTYWLYTAPAGQRITLIWNATNSAVDYIDTDHAVDIFYPPDNLVQEFRIKGDTSGNDIGNCTTDDAYLTVYLEPLWVWVE